MSFPCTREPSEPHVPALGRQVGAFEAADAEALVRTLLNAIPDMVWLKSTEGLYLACNPAFERFFGVPEAQILGRSDADFCSPEEAALFREHDRRALQAGAPTRNEEWITLADGGERILLETTKTPMHDDDGKLIGVLGVGRDMTARWEAQQQLAAQQERFRALSEASFESIFISEKGRCIEQNQTAQTVFGYTDDEAVGRMGTEWIAPQDRERVMQNMLSGHDKPYEVLALRKDGTTFAAMLRGKMAHYQGRTVRVTTLLDISELKHAEEEIRHLAFYDPLTRLPNRRLLLDRLHHALVSNARRAQVGALMFIDLDHFKNLNDTQGHDQGDLLLVQVAQRLRLTVRGEDTVARLGGDEFVVMLESLGATREEAATQARLVAAKLHENLNRPYSVGERICHSTSSIGVVLFESADDTVEELLKRADMAMYQAKAHGRNGVQFFDPTMQALVNARARLEAELHQALARDQLLLHYQVQVDALGDVVGVEALVRWQHPVRGLLCPGAFICQAEESGLIVPLGQWVLRAACAQLVRWQQAGGEQARWSMAVNVSARQFHEPDFVQQVLKVVQSSGAPAQRIKLELTESLLADDVNDIIDKMQALRAHGLGFAMDDFGTGYSSLSYLKRLPLQQLKIDRSFVRDLLTDPNDAAIARTIVALGHTLGLTVLAEGVETTEQHRALLEMGCRQFQGYLFGKPVESQMLPIAQLV